MTTINLEKSLIRSNRKIATPRELLLIKEYEMHSELLENDALSRVGFNKTIQAGRRIKTDIDSRMKQTESFSQDRVFHISQIMEVCEKYYLRFLPTEFYHGVIDKSLPTKITNFEAAYGVKCSIHNTKICAPVESFELQERPKDPLFFYAINDEYYYLIHKWGDDLSISRRMLALFSNGLVTFLTILAALIVMVLLLTGVAKLITIILGFVWMLVCGLHVLIEDEPLRFVKENDWDSHRK